MFPQFKINGWEVKKIVSSSPFKILGIFAEHTHLSKFFLCEVWRVCDMLNDFILSYLLCSKCIYLEIPYVYYVGTSVFNTCYHGIPPVLKYG